MGLLLTSQATCPAALVASSTSDWSLNCSLQAAQTSNRLAVGPAIAYLSASAKKARSAGGPRPGEAELAAGIVAWFVANGERVVGLVVRALADVDMMEEVTLPR